MTQKSSYQAIPLGMTQGQPHTLGKQYQTQVVASASSSQCARAESRRMQISCQGITSKNELTITNTARYLRSASERGDGQKTLHPKEENP